MKTKIKVSEKINENRRKHHPHLKNKTVVQKNKFVITKDDYDDFIGIKKQRRNKYFELSNMNFYIGLTISLLLITTAFNWKFYDNNSTVNLLAVEETTFEEIQDTPLTEQPPPPPPSVIQLPSIVEVADEVILEEVKIDMDVEITEDMSIEDVVFEPMEIVEEEAEEIFYIVEHQPEPIGGIKAFYTYVSDNMVYPRSSLRARIQGRVFVRFIVDENGDISDAKIIKGIDKACDNEALRVIQNAPRWKPGKQRGTPVKVYMSLPITFKIRS